MMNQLTDKVALLTGATGGIGKHIANALKDKGVRLLLTDVDDNLLKKAYGEWNDCVCIASDLTKEREPQRVIAQCKKNYGNLDILINAIGIGSRQSVLEADRNVFFKHIEINAWIPVAMCQAAIPLLLESDAGEIISISSSAGVNPYVGQACYSASKHTLNALMRILTMELHDTGVRVHTIAPTGVDTELIRITRPDLEGDAYCKPEEIAEIIIFILTHRNNSVIDEVNIRRHAKPPFEL